MTTPPAVQQTLAWCTQHLGLTASPNGDSGCPVGDWQEDFGKLGEPWCGTFVGYALRHVAGIEVPSGIAWTPNIIEYARSGTGGFEGWHPWSRRTPGDLVLFKWGASSAPCDHVGILDEDRVHTIEGNTSPHSGGSQNQGGGVYRRRRDAGVIVGCARPRYR